MVCTKSQRPVSALCVGGSLRKHCGTTEEAGGNKDREATLAGRSERAETLRTL